MTDEGRAETIGQKGRETQNLHKPLQDGRQCTQARVPFVPKYTLVCPQQAPGRARRDPQAQRTLQVVRHTAGALDRAEMSHRLRQVLRKGVRPHHLTD